MPKNSYSQHANKLGIVIIYVFLLLYRRRETALYKHSPYFLADTGEPYFLKPNFSIS